MTTTTRCAVMLSFALTGCAHASSNAPVWEPPMQARSAPMEQGPTVSVERPVQCSDLPVAPIGAPVDSNATLIECAHATDYSACVIDRLEGRDSGALELRALVLAHRQRGEAQETRAAMCRFVDRFPTHRLADDYRADLAQQTRPTRAATGPVIECGREPDYTACIIARLGDRSDLSTVELRALIIAYGSRRDEAEAGLRLAIERYISLDPGSEEAAVFRARLAAHQPSD